jgi:phosphoribosyl 1,2-cyclic phosphodiesterase
VKVQFWGTRGTRPAPGRRTLRYGGNTTCVEVRDSQGDRVIIDSGTGIVELGATLAKKGPLDLHLLITHTHWDHIQGFPFFGPAFVEGTRLTIVGPAGSIKSLKNAFGDIMEPAYWPVGLDQMAASIDFVEVNAGETFAIGGLQVTPHEMRHPIATLGYRLEEGGSSFAFATDNEIMSGNGGMPALAEWCQGADLLAHDAQYSDDEYPSHRGWGHSTFGEALKLAETAAVRQLAFVHHDPQHSDEEIDQLVEQALTKHERAGGGRVVAFPAAEELTIEL